MTSYAQKLKHDEESLSLRGTGVILSPYRLINTNYELREGKKEAKSSLY